VNIHLKCTTLWILGWSKFEVFCAPCVHFGWKGESIHPPLSMLASTTPRLIKFNIVCKLFPHPTHKHERLDNVEREDQLNAATWTNPCDCPLFHKVTCIFHIYLVVWFNLFSLECSSQPSQGHVSNSCDSKGLEYISALYEIHLVFVHFFNLHFLL
jgi:hypothetical protein